jgi:transposase InsO family protein
MPQHEQLRLVNWRLKILREADEAPRRVAFVCRRYGISRKTFYKWKKRYAEDGLSGLRDRHHAPFHCPRATHPEIVQKILYLRQHYGFGPWRIRMYLHRYHDIVVADQTVYRILRRHGLNRLPQNQRFKPHKQRWRRYEKPLPGYRIQIDAKFLEAIPGKRRSYWQFTAIDDCTRLRILKIYERNNQHSATNFVDYVLSRLPFQVQTIQTDNGPEFSAQFHWHVQDKGIAHIYIKPRTPRLNGKVERSHRIDDEEFYRLLEGVVIHDINSFNVKVQEWESYYNYHRPHGALGGQSPYERLRQKAGISE